MLGLIYILSITLYGHVIRLTGFKLSRCSCDIVAFFVLDLCDAVELLVYSIAFCIVYRYLKGLSLCLIVCFYNYILICQCNLRDIELYCRCRLGEVVLTLYDNASHLLACVLLISILIGYCEVTSCYEIVSVEGYLYICLSAVLCVNCFFSCYNKPIAKC